MQKIYKYFFYSFIIIFFLSIFLVTFNSNFRTKALHYLINSYKVYMIVSIQSYLKSDNRNLIFINNKLLNFINFSKNFSYGKNKLLIGIYDTTNLVQSSLNNDKEFLMKGDVFSSDMIEAYIELKMEDVTRLRMTTHPAEFDMYYSV